MSRVFANGLGDHGSIPSGVRTKTQKMVFDDALLNNQHYEVQVNGEVEQSRFWNNALPLHLSVVAIENGAFVSPSSKVTKFISIYLALCKIMERWLV